MKVYLPHYDGKPAHNVFVQPGIHHPVTDWLDKDGKPVMFTVTFKYGRAEVPDNLGRYMVENNIAQPSPIVVVQAKDLAAGGGLHSLAKEARNSVKAQVFTSGNRIQERAVA